MSSVNILSEQPVTGEKPGVGAAAILEAAIPLFAERGFEAVALSAIAERAGVCKSNIFHHFGSKELLYVAVVRHGGTRRSAAIPPRAAKGACTKRDKRGRI